MGFKALVFNGMKGGRGFLDMCVVFWGVRE